MQIFLTICYFLNPFPIKLILCDFKGGRMVEIKNEEQEETMREVGHLLLEVMCLARLRKLAFNSCMCDDELQSMVS